MKMVQAHVGRLFSGVVTTVFGLFPVLALAQDTGMRGGMGHMMGGVWMVGLIGILVIVVLVLSVAALIKYLLRK